MMKRKKKKRKHAIRRNWKMSKIGLAILSLEKTRYSMNLAEQRRLLRYCNEDGLWKSLEVKEE